MSMLAEPRRKQKVINLRVKNNAWSNDSTKFGQRMLEKMGWSAGKGLGAKENGIVEHVIARYKNDDKGLGYEDKNDQWTKHEDDFNALLSNLSNENDTNSEVLHSGVSLEVKSKKSKARIHYHKFTRGKDISRYSEKDLANIFGKKSFKSENTEESLKDHVETPEQVFTEKGSMEDYFKSKMAALKSKNKITTSTNEDNNDSNENCDFAFRGFSCTNNEDMNEKAETEENVNMENQEISKEFQSEMVPKKQKKKKSKNNDIFESKNEMNSYIEDTKDLIENNHGQESELPKKNKKNKKKSKPDKINVQENTIDIDKNVETTKPKKKKHKDSNIDEIDKQCSEEQQDCDTSVKNHKGLIEDDGAPKKKKKRKNK